jgi:hypothetical protein
VKALSFCDVWSKPNTSAHSQGTAQCGNAVLKVSGASSVVANPKVEGESRALLIIMVEHEFLACATDVSEKSIGSFWRHGHCSTRMF